MKRMKKNYFCFFNFCSDSDPYLIVKLGSATQSVNNSFYFLVFWAGTQRTDWFFLIYFFLFWFRLAKDSWRTILLHNSERCLSSRLNCLVILHLKFNCGTTMSSQEMISCVRLGLIWKIVSTPKNGDNLLIHQLKLDHFSIPPAVFRKGN